MKDIEQLTIDDLFNELRKRTRNCVLSFDYDSPGESGKSPVGQAVFWSGGPAACLGLVQLANARLGMMIHIAMKPETPS